MKKYKIAATAMLACFALGAASCMLSFAYMSIRELSRQNRLEKQAAFRLQESESRKLSEEHRNWRELPEELQRFRRDYFISMDDFAAFRRDLNSCLAANGFTAANITSQFGRSLSKTRKVTISFSLEGPYRNLKKFIYDMEQKPKMHFFERIELSSRGETVSGKFKMEATLDE